jgi:hypothetical protein
MKFHTEVTRHDIRELIFLTNSKSKASRKKDETLRKIWAAFFGIAFLLLNLKPAARDSGYLYFAYNALRILTALCFWANAGILWIRRNIENQVMRKVENGVAGAEIEIREDGVRCDSDDGHSKIFTGWPYVSKLIISPEMYVFATVNGINTLFHRRWIAGREDELNALIEQHVAPEKIFRRL